MEYSFPFFENGKRIEKTPLGVFSAFVDEEKRIVSDVNFQMALPKIPRSLLNEVIAEFKKDLTREDMINVYWSDDGQYYYTQKPSFVATKVSVDYEMPRNSDILVVQCHSHNTMPAVFSRIDDEDELMTGLYLVIGRLNTPTVQANLRCGMEGCFGRLRLSDVFQ